MRTLTGWLHEAQQGEATCTRVGLSAEAAGLHAARAEIRRQLNAASKELYRENGPDLLTPAASASSKAACSTHWEMVSACKGSSHREVEGTLRTRSFEASSTTPGIQVDPVTCENTWRSWVDAPNSFNAKIRTSFVCTVPRSEVGCNLG